MNDDKELKSLREFYTRHNITSSLMIHGIPDQKISEYLARIPKSETEKARKMILKEYSKLSQDQIQYRLALLFGKKINAMHDEQWKEYKKSLENIPSYLILQKASDLVLDYAHEKRPKVISWFDDKDDFIELWQKLEQMSLDLDKVTTIDKALKTVRDFNPNELL